MKNKIVTILLCFVLALVFFVGCNQIPLKNNPTTSAVSTGNGGLSVQKDNYLYFTNGFFKVESFNETTYLDGDNYLGAIYRVKLNNGELEYTDGVLNNVELVSNKIVGNEVTKLYIFGDTLYFASPNTLKDSTDKVRTDLPVFYSMNINGTNLTKLYSPTTYSKGDYAFYNDGTNTYLSFFDGSQLSLLTFNNRNKCTKNIVIAKGVSSVIMPSINSFDPNNATMNEYDSCIYYTRSFNEDESDLINGNVMAKVSVINQTEIKLKNDNANTYTLKNYANRKLYFTKADYQSYFSSTNYYYISANASDFATNEGTQVTAMAYTNVLVVDDENGHNRGVVAYNETSLYYIAGINTPAVQIYTGTITLLKTQGDDVYFVEENVLKKINFLTKTVTYLSADEIKLDTGATTNFSIDSNSSYIYYYVTHTGDNEATGAYLSRTKTNTLNPSTELVGRVLDKHIPTPEEE